MADRATGLYIQRAFEELGCYVKTVDAKINPKTAYNVFNSEIFDLIFCSRTPAILPEIKSIMAETQVPCICWNVDKRKDIRSFGDTLLGLFNEVDILYTAAKGNIKQYEELCPNTIIKHLPQGADPHFHHKYKLTDEDRERYSCDVMFSGSVSPVHKGRRELLRYLQTRCNIQVYGCLGEDRITGVELAKANQCAKIVLGHSGIPIEQSSSVRDYITCANGGFLLTEYCEGMERQFTGMCDWYRNKEECLEKIGYYITHSAERKAIQDVGYKEVHKKHKYLDRIKTVLKDANQLWEQRLSNSTQV